MKLPVPVMLGAAIAVLVAACAASPPLQPTPGLTAPSRGDAPSPTAPPAAEPPATVVAPNPTVAAPTETAGPPAGTAIAEALAFVPPGADSLFFTDWAAIRRQLEIEHVTGATPTDEKFAALREGFLGDAAEGAPPSEASFGGFALAYLRVHYETWSFDALDLEWELSIQSGGAPPLWVLRFGQGFDLGTVAARFGEHGFTAQELPNGTLHSIAHADWIRTGSFGTTELAMATTGFLADGRTLVLGGDPDGDGAGTVRAMLTGAPPAAGGPAVDDAARLLDEPYTAALIVGDDQCAGYDPMSLAPDEIRETVGQLVERAGRLSPYDVLAIGYSRERSPIGRIVLRYPEAQVAAADLEGRQLLAAEGISLTSGGRPYADVVFTLQGARVDDRAIVLDVAPESDAPTRLTGLLQRRDLLFAHCST